MFHKTLPGFIEVICGSMFSGKTEELLRRLKRAQIGRQKVQVFKPIIDNRYSADHVQSHDASRILSRPVHHAREILDLVDDNTRVVGIDEAQFFDESVIDVAQKLAYRGIRVVVAGLDLDFMGQPFGPMPKLLAVSESVTKLQAVCMVCGGPATRSQRLSAAGNKATDQVLVGAKDFYEARCRFCHEPDLARPEPVSPGLIQKPASSVQTAVPAGH
ncbi:MAG: thymidine kinase [Bdellovibrionales bacterium]|nr:thymidine kinase [Bdellovibrionales bacterium]